MYVYCFALKLLTLQIRCISNQLTYLIEEISPTPEVLIANT